MKQIPVYLFTGFLEAGKTRFIQETLEDRRFNQGERTLLLLCEEGEESYTPDSFSTRCVFVEVLEEQKQLNAAVLDALLKKHDAERVLIEYNGMWMLDALYASMPDNWVLVQNFMFVEAATFLSYNDNLRALVVNKLKDCQLVVFNRTSAAMDRMRFHKIVRAANRRCQIVYEFADGKVEYDEIQDPLPFDLHAPVIDIAEANYPLWYTDMAGAMSKYAGKTVRFKGQALLQSKMPAGFFVIGRQVMTCCSNDVQFMGLACKYDQPVKNKSWLVITGSISIENNRLYKSKGPVLKVISAEPAQAPAEPIL